MGRFESTVEFYSRCREPYPAEFFKIVVERLALKGNESLLDVGCGPAPLAIGFAPFVGSCTGLDPEAAMIKAAQRAAEESGVILALQLGRIEDYPPVKVFDVVTIGRALHWLDRGAAIAKLERIVSASGRMLVCGATSMESSSSPWLKPYRDICNLWSDDPDRQRYQINAKDWFAGSQFVEVGDDSIEYSQRVSMNDLIGRALSKSNTSPSVVKGRQAEFENAIHAVIQPFSQDGYVEERIEARAAIFGRPA